MNKRSIELWVGLLVLAGLFSLGFLAVNVGNFDAARVRDGYRVYANFGNVGGLTTKAPVSMAGVRIGRVIAITLDRESYEARVAMRIDSRYDAIPADSSAAIYTQGLLGAQYIGIEPGGDRAYLAEGTEIDLTQSALVLEQLVGQLIDRLLSNSARDAK